MSVLFPRVALVGRPNVGKSRLFNRIAGGRDAIVHDQPGVTRDVLAKDVSEGFTLLDTGGIGMAESGASAEIVQAVDDQVFVAVESSDLILLVVDAREGLVPLDEEVAHRLRRFARCPVCIVANKCDNDQISAQLDEFHRLGFGEPIAVSAEHRIGIGRLLDFITDTIPCVVPTVGEPEPHRIRICMAGKPNVGKSSIGNRLLSADRLIVSDLPGTTRDSISYDLDWKAPDGTTALFRLMDTAGLRHKHKVDNSVEYFSTVRTRKAIENSDVVFLLLDALTGVTRQDKVLAGEILEAGRALVLVVNKWDLALETFRQGGVQGYKNEKDFRNGYLKAARKELFFLPSSPVLFLSAKTGLGTTDILQVAQRLDEMQRKTLPTGPLNRTIRELIEKRAPRRIHGKPFKVYYAVQTGIIPYRFRLFCNRPDKFEDTYRRYLENGLLEAFGLEGIPIQFILAGKERRYLPKEED